MRQLGARVVSRGRGPSGVALAAGLALDERRGAIVEIDMAGIPRVLLGPRDALPWDALSPVRRREAERLFQWADIVASTGMRVALPVAEDAEVLVRSVAATWVTSIDQALVAERLADAAAVVAAERFPDRTIASRAVPLFHPLTGEELGLAATIEVAAHGVVLRSAMAPLPGLYGLLPEADVVDHLAVLAERLLDTAETASPLAVSPLRPNARLLTRRPRRARVSGRSPSA